jgi:Homeodomain-like domain-containing protein
MPAMITRRIVLHAKTRAKLEKDAKRCRDADTRIRYRTVLLSDQGYSGRKIAKALGCSTSTVSRTLFRWEMYGQAGLIDRREDNGEVLADDWYIRTVAWILESTPKEFFHSPAHLDQATAHRDGQAIHRRDDKPDHHGTCA